MNRELPHVQAGFRKDRGTRDQTANIHWIIEKAREFQEKKNIFVSLTTLKPLCGSQQVWKILKEKGIPDHFTHLPRNLYVGLSNS